MIRAVPLWQPWASLVAVGAKRIETRPKPAPSTILGQRVVIHACLTPRELWRTRDERDIRAALKSARDAGTLAEVDDALPLGHLLATAVVTGTELMDNAFCARLYQQDPQEHAFGWYRPGRHAWFLGDVRPLPAPVPFKGKQGIFLVPNELVGEPEQVEPVQEVLL